jgi:hypothetical protein
VGRDAVVSALLGELAGLLLDCARHCPGELPGYLQQHVFPQLSTASPALQARPACFIPFPSGRL